MIEVGSLRAAGATQQWPHSVHGSEFFFNHDRRKALDRGRSDEIKSQRQNHWTAPAFEKEDAPGFYEILELKLETTSAGMMNASREHAFERDPNKICAHVKEATQPFVAILEACEIMSRPQLDRP
jgi:hypothetical protein